MHDYLKEWREFRGFTVRQLAAMIGVGYPLVNDYENGKAEFKLDYLEKFSDAVGCQHYLDPLMRPPDQLWLNGQPIEPGSPEFKRILKFIESLNENHILKIPRKSKKKP